MTYRLRLAHLYPEQMNIYGDRGNILTLVRRCQWRGIEVELLPVGVGAPIDWPEVDMAFFGGGQDSGQALIATDFVERQGPQIRAAIEGGLVMLAICGGYQLLGHYFLTHTEERLPGIGLLDLHTVGGKKRFIGDVVVSANLEKLTPATLVGFENHSGRTFLGPKARPLGKVMVGRGNNGSDRTEGCVQGGVIGTYLHGSLLPKNPQLADYLILKALERRGVGELSPLDDSAELAAHGWILQRSQRR